MSKGQQQEHIELEDVRIKARTLRAVLIVYEDAEHWIPLSQVDGDPIVDVSKTIRLTPWIMEQRGIEP